MTRPRRRQPGAPAPRRRHPSPQAPPSGAGAGRFTHWSHLGGGTSSSGISTSTARLSSTGAGAGGIDGAVTAMVMATVRVATTCCGSTAAAVMHGSSPVAVAAFPAARGALDERHLVGTDASALSAFAGAGGDGRRHPANAKSKITNSRPSKRSVWKSYGLPQGGEAPLPLPRGLSGR
jgi:hypothetical protein